MEHNFVINNLDCAHCGAKIEEAINRLDGVESAVLNYPLKKMKICGNITDELLKLINETARAIEPEVEIVRAERARHAHHHHEYHHEHCHDDHCECGHEHHHEHSHEEHHHDHCHDDHCECGHEHAHEHHHEHGESKKELAVIAAGAVLFIAAVLTGSLLNIRPHRISAMLPLKKLLLRKE